MLPIESAAGLAAHISPVLSKFGLSELGQSELGQSARDAVSQLWTSGIDGVGLLLIVVFALLGLVRGLWWQVIRLLGLVAAALIARALAPRVAPAVSRSLEDLDPRLVQGFLWILIFITGLALFAVVGRLGRRALEAIQLGWLDRFGGLVAGAITGLLIHAALVFGLLQVGSETWAADTVAGTRSEELVETLGRELPLLLDQRSAERIEDILGRGERSSGERDTDGMQDAAEQRDGERPSSGSKVR